MRLKKGDKVEVISGKDRGRSGTIEKVLPQKNKVLIPGINVYKKHARARGQNKGGIIDIVRPLDASKVALVCSKCKKTTRIGYRVEDKGKVRICHRCQEVV